MSRSVSGVTPARLAGIGYPAPAGEPAASLRRPPDPVRALPTRPDGPEEPEGPQLGDLKRAVEDANRLLEQRRVEARFSISQETRRIVVTLTNAATGEVVMEVPPQRLAAALANIVKGCGALVDERG